MMKTWYFSNEGGLLNSKENDGGYTLEFRAAGLKKDEVEVYFDNNILVVKSNHEPDETNNDWVRQDFSYDKIDKRLIVPEDTDYEKVDAKLEDGILHIDLYKRDGTGRKLIEVL